MLDRVARSALLRGASAAVAHSLKPAFQGDGASLLSRLSAERRVLCSLGQDSSAERAPVPYGAPAVNESFEPLADEVFRCDGIERAARQMRRRVQLGIFLEVAGTQFSNFLHHSEWRDYVHAMETFHFENSAILLGAHVILMWKYHTFLRDALMARHVTSIATTTPEALSDADPDTCIVVIVETGPWARRVQLRPLMIGTRSDEVDEHKSKVSFGQLLELGLLHADRSRGNVLDAGKFDDLLHGGLAVGREEIRTDVASAHYAFVSPYKIMPFLADAGVSESTHSFDSILERLKQHQWAHKVCQLPGGVMMRCYGNLSLAMGLGTVAVWLMPKDYLKAAWRKEQLDV